MDHPFYSDIHDPYVEEALTRDPVSEDVEVVIVGGGFSGLLMAVSLQREGINDYRVIEKGSDIGGTLY